MARYKINLSSEKNMAYAIFAFLLFIFPVVINFLDHGICPLFISKTYAIFISCMSVIFLTGVISNRGQISKWSGRILLYGGFNSEARQG